jgi:hypothetical protein
MELSDHLVTHVLASWGKEMFEKEKREKYRKKCNFSEQKVKRTYICKFRLFPAVNRFHVKTSIN